MSGSRMTILSCRLSYLRQIRCWNHSVVDAKQDLVQDIASVRDKELLVLNFVYMSCLKSYEFKTCFLDSPWSNYIKWEVLTSPHYISHELIF